MINYKFLQLKSILGCSMFLIYFSANAQTEKTYPTKADRKKFYNEISTKYSPADVQKIWKSDATVEEFDQWVDGRKESKIIDEYATCIHELYHDICNMVDEGQNYYINKDLMIYVPHTDVYNSTKLNDVVRKGQQDSIFRYGLYVGSKNVMPDGTVTDKINTNSSNQASSMQDGIYGLLEEFSAYYYGTYTNYYLEDYYLNKFGNADKDAWYNYTHSVLGDAMAYYEFRLFMGWYLVHAKEKYPEVYKGISNNKALRIVYTIMTDKFTQLQDSILLKMPKELEIVDDEADYIHTLDLSGSDEDMLRFFELYGLEEDEEIYQKVTKNVNGKLVVSIKIIDAEEFNDYYKEEYLEVVEEIKEIKADMVNEMLIFLASPEKEIPYLKEQFTKDMLDELMKLRLEGVTEKNYKDYLK